MFGAATLIIAISALAFLLPDGVHLVGGVEHQQPRLVDHDPRFGDALQRHRLVGDRACRTRRVTWRAGTFFPARPRPARSAACSDGCARAQPPLRDLEAAPFAQQHVGRRHADVVERDFGVAVRRVVVAEHRQMRTIFTPGASIGTRIMLCCSWRFALSGSVLPMKMAILQRGSGAPVVHHLRPLIT